MKNRLVHAYWNVVCFFYDIMRFFWRRRNKRHSEYWKKHKDNSCANLPMW